MFDYIKPKDLHFEELSDTYGRLVIEPLEGGFGTTLGNTFRRVLLSMIPGAAVTQVRFDGKYHEYDTIEGVREDVIEIIMNIKELSFRLEDDESKRIYLESEGDGEVNANQLELEPGVEVVNKEQKIAHMTDGGSLGIEMKLQPGMGYKSAEENKEEDLPLAVIPIDSNFSPVQKVNFDVNKIRAEGRENCDQLIMEIETNGGVTPEEAVGEASRVLSNHFKLFESLPQHPFGELESFEEEEDETPEEYEKTLEELGFNQRACNLLREKGVETLEDLIEKTSTELLDIHGFGKKTLQKVENNLEDLGYYLADREDENGS